ncbi:hypothetical protein CC78DRAFT_286361 [Lojkania enalia]|uniref:Uncharacterized protein n=1 Tax=Lojkania enalia TaxID=147567 RepID=A0A9P4K5A4_9PLEO|nr:hypothetical protein CC78DRAFT_286361 [Didymosphaeria enalia]
MTYIHRYKGVVREQLVIYIYISTYFISIVTAPSIHPENPFWDKIAYEALNKAVSYHSVIITSIHPTAHTHKNQDPNTHHPPILSHQPITRKKTPSHRQKSMNLPIFAFLIHTNPIP